MTREPSGHLSSPGRWLGALALPWALLGCGAPGPAPADAASSSDAASSDALGDADGGPAADAADGNLVTYRVQALIGGLDRLVVSKRDQGAGLCTVVRLVYPAFGGPQAIDLPADWGTEYAYVHNDLASCNDLSSPPADGVMADMATGTINWPTDELYPAELSTVDVTLSFTQSMPWVPASVTLTASALPVQQ